MKREFVAGDRVQSKRGGPIMEVIKYVTEPQIAVGEVFSDHLVECVWFENGERKKEIYDQRTLFKIYD